MNEFTKPTIKKAIITLVILTSISLFQVYHDIRKEILIGTTGYPLTNGYGYLVVGSSEHWLLKRPIDSDNAIQQSDYIDLGYHLNRLYFDCRYIAGEITQKPSSTEYEDFSKDEKGYLYFIVDTEAHNYLLNLSESEFEVQLKRLGIHKSVELSGRDDLNWLEKRRINLFRNSTVL